jgi:hypothetical protein
VTGSKRVVHWTSETWCECSEIAGSPQGLGTILAPTCPASCSPPPSFWSVVAAWSHPFSRSMMAPTQSCAAAPVPSPSESGRGTRWSPSAALRLARPWTSCLATHVAVEDRQASAQAVPQPSGSSFQTCWSLHLPLLRRRHKTVPEPFSYPARRFLHARDWQGLHSLHRRGTRFVNGHRPRG